MIATTQAPRRTKRERNRMLLLALAQLVSVLVILLPMIWLYLGSFRTNLDLSKGSLLPQTFTLANFRAVFAQGFGTALRNSAIVSIVVSVVSTLFATLAAYGLGRFAFRGRGFLNTLILAGQTIPALVILVPLVVVLRRLDLTNSLVGLAISYLPIGVPISVYMLRSALLALPKEVEEAAMCDGCSRTGVVRRVVLPLLRPTVIAVGAFTFTLCWGEYLFALSILTGGAQQTGPLALQSLFNLYTLPLGTILAGGVVISLPVVVLFLIVQRHLVGGLVGGATKG